MRVELEDAGVRIAEQDQGSIDLESSSQSIFLVE